MGRHIMGREGTVVLLVGDLGLVAATWGDHFVCVVAFVFEMLQVV